MNSFLEEFSLFRKARPNPTCKYRNKQTLSQVKTLR